MNKIILSLIPGLIFAASFYTLYFGEENFIFRLYGGLAFFYINLSLLISPLAYLFKIRYLLPYRKIFGLWMFAIMFLHIYEYMIAAGKYDQLLTLQQFYYGDISTGSIAFILILGVGFTSNKWSMKKLGKRWIMIQSLVYPVFLISSIHTAYTGRLNSFYILLIVLLVFFRTWVYIKKISLISKK